MILVGDCFKTPHFLLSPYTASNRPSLIVLSPSYTAASQQETTVCRPLLEKAIRERHILKPSPTLGSCWIFEEKHISSHGSKVKYALKKSRAGTGQGSRKAE